MTAPDRPSATRGAPWDERALTDLMLRHGPRLRHVAGRLLGDAEGHETADDVLQDAFLRARTRLAGIRQADEASVVAWLGRLIQRLTLDARRRRHRQQCLVERLGQVAAAEKRVREADPAEQVMAALADRQALAAVGTALARLPAGQRRALLLRSRLTVAEVAAALDCSQGAVRTRLARARAACRRALLPRDHDDQFAEAGG